MDILFYGNHYWDRGPWFRKQFFASFLAERKHRVFYIETSVSIFRWRRKSKNHLLFSRLSNPQENLFVITPSVFFPFPNNYLSRHLFNLKLLIEIKRIFRKLKVREFIVWFNILNFSTVLSRIEARKIIFDLSDDIPLFYKLKNADNQYKNYMRLLEKSYAHASIAIVSAVKIKEKYQHLINSEIIVIPNGHNFSSFRRQSLDLPEDIKDIPGPVIGFIGTLFIFIDDELLEHVISKRPDYQYVFVGKIQKEFPIERISKYPNVHLLGEKNKEEIGNYIKAFDVCINPFKRHEVNDSVSPLKVYEYIAFKKPIVSSYMYSLQKQEVAKYIRFCKDPASFLDTLDEIVGKKAFINVIPEEVLQNSRWDMLFKQLLSQIKSSHQFEL